MIPLSLARICAATGARPDPAEGVDVAATRVDGPVVTDSRQAGPGSLYVARIGEHADGHRYLPAAERAGAVAALTSRGRAELAADGIHTGLTLLQVDDVQTALGRVAREVLDAAPGLPVVGITGSSGKTSTKDLLAAVLATDRPTVAPEASLNGEIGVPLTVCRITPDTRHLVVEMGARGIGHIAYLTDIAPPRTAIVLNVGSAHLGEFGGPDAIARAKGELVQALPAAADGGVAVLNRDDPRVWAMRERTDARIVAVGRHESADLRAGDIRLDDAGRPGFTLVAGADAPGGPGRAEVTLRLHGAHHVGNALAVAAAALAAGMPLPAVADALGAARAASRWRMEVTARADGVTVVNDAYNANPESMDAALTALATMRGRPADATRRIAVLGGMLELGDEAPALHAQVGATAVAHGVDELVAVGPLARHIADGAERAGLPAVQVARVEDADAAYDRLGKVLRPGDVVLFKSSRDSGLRWLGDRVAGVGTGMEGG